jgi:hypothetical protein
MSYIQKLKEEINELNARLEKIRDCQDLKCSLCKDCIAQIQLPIKRKKIPLIRYDDPIRTYRPSTNNTSNNKKSAA